MQHELEKYIVEWDNAEMSRVSRHVFRDNLFAQYLEEEDIKDGMVLEYFERTFDGERIVDNNAVRFDAQVAIIYFEDGHRLETWNSEWGGLRIH